MDTRLNIDFHRPGSRQGKLPGPEVVQNKFGKIDCLERKFDAPLLKTVGGEKIVDQRPEPVGVGEHGVEKGLHFQRWRGITTNRLEVQL